MHAGFQMLQAAMQAHLPDVTVALQMHDPLVSWASSEFGASFATGDSIFGVEQSSAVEAAVEGLPSLTEGSCKGSRAC